MKKIILLFIPVLFFISLQAEEILLNLPKKFDVKVSQRWITENGIKMTDDHILKELRRPLIFHFNGESFSFMDTRHQYGGYDHVFVSSSGSGSFKKGILKGTDRYKTYLYVESKLHNNELFHKSSGKSTISGQVDSTGKLHIVSSNYSMESCVQRVWKTGEDNTPYLSTHFERCPYGWENDSNRYKAHYILQLPVGELQSSQKFISDIPVETKPKPILNVQTPIAVSIGAVTKDTQESEEVPYQDEAMMEYQKSEKERIAKEKVWGQAEIEKEKIIEAQEKAQEEYQAMRDKWNEEERQANIKHREALAKQKKKSEEIEIKENKAFHDNVAKDMKERRDKQIEIKKAHEIVNKFGDDYDNQRLTHKKIDELSKGADIEKVTKIKNAVKKQYYESQKMKQQGEAEYQTFKAKEIDKKGKYVESIKDTSLTVNKGLAKLDPTGTGDKIVSWQENAYSGIEGYEKGGFSGAADNLIEKKASDMSNGWSDTVKEEIKTYKKYQKEGIELKKNEVYYDKKGNRLTKVKKWEKIYDKDGNEVSFSYGKRLFKNTIIKLNDDYNSINTAATKVEEFKEGVVTGDFNKAVNAGLDAMDAKDSINESTDKTVKKLEGK